MLQLYRLFIEPLTEPTYQRALLGGSLVAIVCGVVGCYVILRRMAFLGDALSHAMLAGVTAGYLFMQIFFGAEAHALAMFIGSLIAGFITVIMVGLVSRISRVKEDTAIGVMYTGIFALGAILASFFSDRIHIDIYHFVVGSVLSISDDELWLMAIIAALVLSLIVLFHRHLLITSFDPVMASSLGISVIAVDYLLTACTSLVVVAGVPLVAMILVVGMLITPAATAYLLCDRLNRMQVVAAIFGLTSVLGGFYVSTWIGNIATGPTIVFFATIQFLVVLSVAPRYGLLARWNRIRQSVSQELIEDVLGSLLRRGRHDSADHVEPTCFGVNSANRAGHQMAGGTGIYRIAPRGLCVDRNGSGGGPADSAGPSSVGIVSGARGHAHRTIAREGSSPRASA